MSEFSRRGFIGSAAVASLAGLNAAADEEFPFRNNVPDPLLAGDELPTFKFELEKSTGRVIGGSFGKEATVKQLPISKGIAGVSMRLEPGAMRELHWHATAAEWQDVIEGQVECHDVRVARPLPHRDSQPRGCRLYPARVRTFRREYRREELPRFDRLQHGSL